MIRTMVAIAAGYFCITALNSFVHIIISVYFKTDLTLTGIAFLPSATWTVGVTALQFAFGLFGGLLATTIAQKPSKVILGFILIMVAVSLINYTMTAQTEPLWYLILAPLLTISGIYTGYQLQMQNTSS